MLLGDLDLAPRHVGRLLRVERIADAARHKHVQLDAPFALLGLALVALLQIELVRFVGIAARRRGRRLGLRQRVGARRRNAVADRVLRGVAVVFEANCLFIIYNNVKEGREGDKMST